MSPSGLEKFLNRDSLVPEEAESGLHHAVR